MALNKLWTKLFKSNSEIDALALHRAGAIVRHKNPFEGLEVPRNDEQWSQEIADKWVLPFYMKIPIITDTESLESMARASKAIDLPTTSKLLGYFDWRPKTVGAHFAAINGNKELEDIIGRHLLKSEVCYAGKSYSLALALFSTEKSKDYLCKYLDYYLDRKDLWFDQASALCALEYIDLNSATRFMEKWENFISDKPNWNLESLRKHFMNSIISIQQVRLCANQL